MDDLKHVLVQVLDEAEREAAEGVLKKHGDVSMSECYVRGYGSDEDIRELGERGLVVEHFVDKDLSLNWLEPEEEDEGAESLSDEVGSPGYQSPLMELAAASSELCLIQLKGPMRSAWKAELERLRVHLLSYKPEFAYVATLAPGARGHVEALDFVARVVDYQPGKRLRQIREDTRRAKAIYAEQTEKIKERLKGKVRELREQGLDAVEKALGSDLEGELESLAPGAGGGGATPRGQSAAERGERGFMDMAGDVLRSAVRGGMDALGGLFRTAERPPANAAGGEAAGGEAAAEAVGPGPTAVEAPGEATAASSAAPPAAEVLALIKYELRCRAPEQTPALAESLRKDPRVRDVEEGRFRIRFVCEEDSPVLNELALLTQVVSQVDPYIEPEIGNDYARVAIGIEAEDRTRLLPWDGTGQTVGVADTGVDKDHPDLKSQVVEIIPRAGDVASTDEIGHGTHVCGIIAGDGTASDGLLRGVASGAKLLVQGIVSGEQKFSGLPIDLGELFKEAYDRGVRIHNNSWGVEVKGLYSIDSYEVDEFVYSHPDFLVIFSAGNDGVQVDTDNPDPDPDGGRIRPMSLRSPATAKNALAVGACCSTRREGGPYVGKAWAQYRGRKPAPKFPDVAQEPICGDHKFLAAFSSRGPSDDERIKPDLVAPGTVIASTRSANAEAKDAYENFDNQYAYMSGTSQAAPVVAGAAAIVRQYYAAVREHANPSAALLKATLLNGAQWIPTRTALWSDVGEPNPHQGFGRLDLQRTLPVPDNAEGFRLLFVDINRGDARALNKSTPGKGRWARRVRVERGIPLRITLAWTDKPGKGLQQDLDLTVTLPDGMKMPDGKSKAVGNHLLKRHPAFQTDHRNNVEQVVIADPEPGFYTISVLAYNTPFEDQGFSLVVTGKLTSDFLP